jgi:hypothetical protein
LALILINNFHITSLLYSFPVFLPFQFMDRLLQFRHLFLSSDLVFNIT